MVMPNGFSSKVFSLNYMLSVFSGLCAAVAIAILAFSNELFPQYGMLMAPFGATAVLVFGLPNSPLAQAKNVIFGHVITASIGVIVFYALGASPWSMGLATGLGISAMLLSGTTHPPAGANPILAIMTAQSWEFILSPVLLGALSICLMGYLANLIRSRIEPIGM